VSFFKVPSLQKTPKFLLKPKVKQSIIAAKPDILESFEEYQP
jgi:hypothetical protein